LIGHEAAPDFDDEPLGVIQYRTHQIQKDTAGGAPPRRLMLAAAFFV
jgi:hypothetical protein